jgi:hypothetical protein
VSAHDDPDEERVWEGHEVAQMRRMAKLTLRQKIEWLEEAQQVVEQLQAARKKAAQP